MIALYHSHQDQLEFDAEVVSCRPAGEQEGLWDVVLSDTAFYPTGGGQPCDAGTLGGGQVVEVSGGEDGAPVVHRVRSGVPLAGTVHGSVDAGRRLDHTQQHSGQHLLSHVLYERYGAYSLGLHVGAQDSYVDLKDDGSFSLTRRDADEIEEEVAQWIARNEPVRCIFPTQEELAALPLRKKPDPHEQLRVVCIGSQEAVACCGTHVSSTGQVQMVRILSWQQSHGNLRVFFVAGLRAVRCALTRAKAAEAAARLFSCGAEGLAFAVERLKQQQAETAHELAKARRELTEQRLGQIQPVNTAQGPLYLAELPGADDAQLRDGLAALTRRDARAVCFLCAPAGEMWSVALGVGAESGANAGAMLRAVLKELGGKGGGRADSAFGRAASMDMARARRALTGELEGQPLA